MSSERQESITTSLVIFEGRQGRDNLHSDRDPNTVDQHLTYVRRIAWPPEETLVTPRSKRKARVCSIYLGQIPRSRHLELDL